jgi:serine protease AprX
MSPRVTRSWRASAGTRRRIGGRVAAAAVATSALAATVLNAGAASAAVNASLGYDPVADKGSLYNIAEQVGAHASYTAGYTGKGIGVALIDSGVSPVQGLTSGNVVNGPDLSFDSQNPGFAHLDGYGHGTHLASIIAGRDVAGTPSSYNGTTNFTGIAPDATLVNVKVGASDGAVDVTQVIAGIDWVVAHAKDLNIRVINLSYGTRAAGAVDDPLWFAVENAWKHGIVVVVAGGNDGDATRFLANPASDPYVLSVGALDTAGTSSNKDDTVPTWSTQGNQQRHVDVVAPGASVLGLRNPNGYADQRNPNARVGSRFAKASGTSQAAAVVSGEVALLLQQNPSLTPDLVKYEFLQSAVSFQANQLLRGAGTTNVRYAQQHSVPASGAVQTYTPATGTGKIDVSRGGSYVNDGGVTLTGERDVFGQAWDGAAWAKASAAVTAWDGGTWRGELWSSAAWNNGAWDPVTWSYTDWAAKTWMSSDWAAKTWMGGSWDAKTWMDSAWSAKTWMESDWAAKTWM